MEAHGSHLRAKEAKKAYPVRLKKCRPHRARPFGAGLERQHGRRASPTADERLRSYSEYGYMKSRVRPTGSYLFRVQKKRDVSTKTSKMSLEGSKI